MHDEHDELDGLLAAADGDDALGRAQLLEQVERGLFGRATNPVTVGRYRILSMLGSGGQGIVYEAHDPQLDRRVAVKLLRTGAGDRPRAHARLLREALALAQLSHPNVVAINDVGEHAAGIYIVTQLVPGDTLARWLETPHSVAEIVATFLSAGAGLQAAHERGIVHRDFKPANVLIGEDGRAMLVDFGLAREADADASSEAEHPASPAPVSPRPDSSGSLTRSGQVMGTPAYMAPEQHTGTSADAAADQYAFCVALYEALWKRRPFQGDSVEALAIAKHTQPVPVPPSIRDVPQGVFRVVARGLAVKPGERWPTMAALIDALSAAARPSRRAVAIIGVVLVAGGLVGLSTLGAAPAAVPACDDPAAWTQTWSDARRQRLTSAFLFTGLTWAQDAADRTAARIDAWGAAWMHERAEACASLETEPSADARIACLDERRIALAETLDVLEQADARAVTRAADAIAALERPASCDSAAGTVVPDAVAAEVASLRQRIARGRALERAGRMKDAVEVLGEAAHAAAQIGHAPVRVEAAIAHGILLRATGEREAAAQQLEAAYLDAEAEGLVPESVEAAIELARVHGAIEGDADAGRSWLRRAETGLARLGDQADPVDHGVLAYTAAEVAGRANDYETGLQRIDRALEIFVEELPPHDFRIGQARRHRASTLAFMHRLDEAEAEGRRALAECERASGPEHPDTGAALSVLSLVAKRRGDFVGALELQRKNLAIGEAAFGKDDLALANVLGQLGVIHSELGNAAEAEAMYRRALAIQREHGGPDDPGLARTLHNFAITLRDRGRGEEASAAWREAITIGQRILGPDHPEVAAYEFMFGLELGNADRLDEALPLMEHSLAITRKSLGPDHPNVAERMAGLAVIERRLRRLGDAREHVDAALAIAQAALGPEHNLVARIRYEHALLLAAEGHHDASLAEHEHVLAEFERTLGASHTAVAESLESIAELHEWLGRPQKAKAALARAQAIKAAAASD